MVPEDADALLEFFRGISKEERFYLKEDVTSPRVIGQWISQMDYWRVLPLVVTIDTRVIADATLHHGRAGARRHTGEVRVLVHPDYADQDVAGIVLGDLIRIASTRGLEKLVFEVVPTSRNRPGPWPRPLGLYPREASGTTSRTSTECPTTLSSWSSM